MSSLDLPSIHDIASGQAPLISCERCHKFKFHYVRTRQFPNLCISCSDEVRRERASKWALPIPHDASRD